MKTERPDLSVAGQATLISSIPLIPAPLRKCPFTWKDQWWWLEYQIDLAASVLQNENDQRFYSHMHQMREEWRLQDHMALKWYKGIEGENHAYLPR